jgi:c-di-GMP-binding flagellar brake protein YcgR
MTHKQNFVERRKHKRFKVGEGTLAEFHELDLLKAGKSRIGKSAPIIDISLGGIGFYYIARDAWSVNFRMLTISKFAGEIRIENVPFKTVSDFLLSRLPNSEPKRRCGIKFDELTPDQKSELNTFIQKHTMRNHGSSPKELE